MGIGGGGLMGTMATGMALGAGSEVGHMAVRGLMGGGSGHGHSNEAPQHQEQQQQQQMSYGQDYGHQQEYAQPQENACNSFHSRFLDCMKMANNDYATCQNHFDMFSQCEKDQSMYQAK